MSFATCLAAVASSANVLVLLCPSVPIRPHRVVMSLPDRDTSQNLLDLPSTNSKYRGVPAAPPDAGVAASVLVDSAPVFALAGGAAFAAAFAPAFAATFTSIRTPT